MAEHAPVASTDATAARVVRARSLVGALSLASALLAPRPGAAAPTVLTADDIAAFTRSSEPAAGTPSTRPSPEGRSDPSPRCALLDAGSEQATTATCTACHAGIRTHPVDVDYARAAATDPSRFVAAEEVVRAGGLLPDGQIRCVTCHDGSSQWKYKLALPPGAVPSPSVAAMQARIASFPDLQVRAAQPMPPGSDVTPTPLCRSCHAM